MTTALYLIPVPLTENFDSQSDFYSLPAGNAEIVKQIRHFIVESRKSAVRFLISLDKNFPIDDCTFTELSEHTDEKTDISKMLSPLEKGQPMGVISDAGCPAVGDPGSRAVEIAHKKNLRVIPLVGPNSMIMSIMASGFNGQNFAFNGYLPVKNNERESKIKVLENRVYKENQTQLFIETPYRNAKMLEAITKSCKGETLLCIASGITTQNEYISTKSIKDWKKLLQKKESDKEFEKFLSEKIPTIFLLYK